MSDESTSEVGEPAEGLVAPSESVPTDTESGPDDRTSAFERDPERRDIDEVILGDTEE